MPAVGRPRKYFTDKDIRDAKNAAKRKSYAKHQTSIADRRRAKRSKSCSKSSPSAEEPGPTEEQPPPAADTANEPEEHAAPSLPLLQTLIDENFEYFESPATPRLQDLLFAAIDDAPNSNEPAVACKYWRQVLRFMEGKQWGQFAYDQLHINDGELYHRRLKNFEELRITLENIEDKVEEVLDTASEKLNAPDLNANSIFVEAKSLYRFVKKGNSQLSEIVRLRRIGLDTLSKFSARGVLRFQNVPEV